MLPVTMDCAVLPAILVGGGLCALKRLATLDAAGVRLHGVFAPEAIPELAEAAGARLARWLPSADDLVSVRLMFVADIPMPLAEHYAALARANRILVNVEDVPRLCDFHVPAIVRRGHMTIAVSTSGRSPFLAARVRRHLERLFPPLWGDRVRRIGLLRDRLRSAGASSEEVRSASEELVAREAWFAADAAPELVLSAPRAAE
jgi:precorrin-2 dehydrogenase/sirohydrochlorin ferrochelatase